MKISHQPTNSRFNSKFIITFFLLFLYSLISSGSQIWGQTTAVNDTFQTDEDTPLTRSLADLISNDNATTLPLAITEINGIPLTGFPQTIQLTNGRLDINGGNFTYTPNPDYNSTFNGDERFSYQIADASIPPEEDLGFVDIEIVPTNDFPQPVDDVNPVLVVSGNSYYISVLDNDSFGGDGPGNQPIQVTALPANVGTVFVDDNGTLNDPTDDRIQYIPVPNYNGQVVITYTIFDTDGSSASAEVSFTARPLAELRISKTVSPGNHYVGDNVTFTLRVNNYGPSDATGIKVVDILPDGYTYDSHTNSGASTYDPDTGLWDVGNIADGGAASMTMDVTINATGNYRNVAEITAADQLDPNGVIHGNNTPGEYDQAEVTVTPIPLTNLVTTKTVDNPSPNVGDIITYTIQVTNAGPSDATNVRLIDQLPSGVSYIDNSLGLDYNPLTGFWLIGDLANGAAAELNIQVRINNGQGGRTITNEILAADINSSQTDPDTTGDILTASVTVTSTELITTKTVDNPTPNEGDTIIYTIQVENRGPSTATNVSLTDILPAGVTYVSDDSGGAYNRGSGIWDIGNLGVGSVTLHITATVDSGTAGTTIINTTTAAEGDQSDPNALADTLSAEITVLEETDIVLTKTVNNSTPNAGETIVYTITVENNGPNDVSSLVVTDVLPSGLTYGTVTPSAGTWTAPDWTIGNLATGEGQTLIIEAVIDPNVATVTPIAITNTVTSSQDQTDNNLTPDVASVDILVTSSELVTTKSVNNTTPSEGETIVYTITVDNNGPSDATNVSLTDVLPTGVTYISATATQGTYNRGSGFWDIGDLANNSSETLTIEVTVDSGTADSTITNTTTAATGDQSDPNAIADTLSAPITVSNQLNLVLTKEVDNPTPNIGDTVSYTITVENQGPTAATNLILIDNLPAGLIEGRVIPSEGTWAAPNWILGNLAPGERQTLIIEALVNPNIGIFTPNAITNTVSNNLTTNEASVDIFVTNADLVTEKRVENANGSPTYNEGDEIIYTIDVENLGPSDATNVSLTDALPPGVTFLSNIPSQGVYNEGSGLWDIGAISNGETATLIIRATINQGTAGTSITNITTAAVGDQSEPSPPSTVDQLEATLFVENETDIVLTKTVDNPNPNAGDTVTYTVTVRNNGPADVTNLVVTDVLPTGLTFGNVTPSEGIWTAPEWIIGDLTVGEEQTIKIEALVGFNTVVTPNTVINRVFNTQDQSDNNNTLDDLEEAITVTSSDLSVTKVVDNLTPNEGDLITYSITVENNGPSDATHVSIEDILPVGVTYVSHTSTQGNYNPGLGLWDIGDVAFGSIPSLQLSATVDAGTVGSTIRNTASIKSSDQSDPDLTNNSDTAIITPVTNVDLSLTKKVLDNDVAPEIGSTITFEIAVTNNGPTKATGVEVEDFLPSGYDFIRYSSTKGQYNSATGVWNLGTIEIGDTEVLLLDVVVLDSGIYNNCAQVIAVNENDIDATNDRDCATITPVEEVDPDLDLRIEKTVVGNNLTPFVDSEISFEIRLINSGEIRGVGVVVTDLLPDGYRFLNYNSTKGPYNPTTGEWTVGTILERETEILIIDAVVNASGNYENCAEITVMNQTEANTSDNISCVTTTPISVIDLELSKEVAISADNPTPISTSGILQPFADTNVDFSITISNFGPSDATGIAVLDSLPSGYEFVSSSATLGSYDATSGIWNLGSLSSGSSEVLTITALVNPVGNWLNTAEIIAANELDVDSTPNNQVLTEDDIDQIATQPIVELTIPEGFTPNGDGINDVFRIEYLEILYPNFAIEIVNRYGNVVYEYKHNGDPFETPVWWDGISTGRWNTSNDQLPAGTYFYTIYFNNNDRKPQTGWVYMRK